MSLTHLLNVDRNRLLHLMYFFCYFSSINCGGCLYMHSGQMTSLPLFLFVKKNLSCPLVVLLVVIGVFCLTGNLALSQSVKTGNPVRVIRGYKLPTIFAPESGYRYDGLYNVTKAWLVLVLGFPTRSH